MQTYGFWIVMAVIGFVAFLLVGGWVKRFTDWWDAAKSPGKWFIVAACLAVPAGIFFGGWMLMSKISAMQQNADQWDTAVLYLAGLGFAIFAGVSMRKWLENTAKVTDEGYLLLGGLCAFGVSVLLFLIFFLWKMEGFRLFVITVATGFASVFWFGRQRFSKGAPASLSALGGAVFAGIVGFLLVMTVPKFDGRKAPQKGPSREKGPSQKQVMTSILEDEDEVVNEAFPAPGGAPQEINRARLARAKLNGARLEQLVRDAMRMKKSLAGYEPEWLSPDNRPNGKAVVDSSWYDAQIGIRYWRPTLRLGRIVWINKLIADLERRASVNKGILTQEDNNVLIREVHDPIADALGYYVVQGEMPKGNRPFHPGDFTLEDQVRRIQNLLERVEANKAEWEAKNK